MSNKIMTRSELIEKMSVEFDGTPVIGLGESWDQGLLAITWGKSRAIKALKSAIDENGFDTDLVDDKSIRKGSSAFEYDAELFGGDGGWRFASDAPKSAPKITYWMIDL